MIGVLIFRRLPFRELPSRSKRSLLIFRKSSKSRMGHRIRVGKAVVAVVLVKLSLDDLSLRTTL